MDEKESLQQQADTASLHILSACIGTSGTSIERKGVMNLF
jgi:hypothetical protein